MKTWITVLCAVALLCVPLVGETHEWTNTRGQKIKAEFISATNEAVTISMKGKTYVVKLADLTPQSRALAAKLRVQKSTAQEPGTKVVVEAPKVVVDLDQLELRDGLMYFKEKPFTGVGVRKYPNGKKEGEVTFKDGKAHGLLTGWYENGQKQSEATLKDGKRHGLFTQWYENGQKLREGTYKDGVLISEKEWDKDGNPVGQDQGDEAPQPVTEAPKIVVDVEKLRFRDRFGYFEDFEGKPFTGVAVEKHPNGKKMGEYTFKGGKRDGLGTNWHENGQKESEATFKDGKFHGLWTYWYENGQKKEEVTFKDGEFHGLRTEWYENGQKWREETYKDGERISSKAWNEDGNPLGQDQGDEAPPAAVEAPKVVVDLSQLERRDGLQYFEGKPFTGVAVLKRSNGQKEEGTFKDGKLDGLWTTWHDNGQKSHEVTYKDGKEHGLGTGWHKNGQKKWERTYKDGKKISAKRWDEDGTPK